MPSRHDRDQVLPLASLQVLKRRPDHYPSGASIVANALKNTGEGYSLARHALGDKAFAAREAEGRAMTLEEALAYAIMTNPYPKSPRGSDASSRTYDS